MSDAAGEVVAEEADSATISNNASSTRTTSTATTSHARHIPAMTTTTTRTESQANISARESGSSNEASDAKQSQPIPQRNGTDRPVLPADLSTLSPDQLQQVWDQQEAYIKSLEQQVVRLKEEGSKMKEQLLQATRRENILILRLTSKDKALLDLRENTDLMKKQGPAAASETVLQKALVDPAVNLVFQRMRKEVEDARIKVSEMQSELSAWKFTPDSTTGKRLMAKCRLLYQENEELGKMISSGKVAKLEGELALQRNFAEEIKKSQSEIDDFLIELDEDFEGMQTTIIGLQTQLKEVKDQLLSFQSNMFKPTDNGTHAADALNGLATTAADDAVMCATAAAPVLVPEISEAGSTQAAIEESVEAAETTDAAPGDASSIDALVPPIHDRNNGSVKRIAASGEGEDSTQDSLVSKRSKADLMEDSDAVISCSMDSSSIVDSSEATPAL